MSCNKVATDKQSEWQEQSPKYTSSSVNKGCSAVLLRVPHVCTYVYKHVCMSVSMRADPSLVLRLRLSLSVYPKIMLS